MIRYLHGIVLEQQDDRVALGRPLAANVQTDVHSMAWSFTGFYHTTSLQSVRARRLCNSSTLLFGAYLFAMGNFSPATGHVGYITVRTWSESRKLKTCRLLMVSACPPWLRMNPRGDTR